MKHRLVHDFAGALVAHHLFERLPGLRIAFIENGADWVGPLLHGLQGMGHPRDFLANVASFPPRGQRRILAENARELTFPR